MFKKFKNTFAIIGVGILVILYEIVQYDSQRTAYTELGNLSTEMKKTPISIAYVVVAVITLYFIGKLKFFQGMQIGKNDPFDRDRKSKGKEVLATIVFGVILFVFIAGFFAIMIK